MIAKKRHAVPALALLGPALLALAAGCSGSGSGSGDDAPIGRGVSVRAVVVPEALSYDAENVGRTYREYGPGIRYSRWGAIREPDLFEVTNGGPGTVAWVAWKHSYTFAVPREVVRREAFLTESEPRLPLRPPFERVVRQEPLAYVDSLPPRTRVLCCRAGARPAWNEGLLYRPEPPGGQGPADAPHDFPQRRAGQVASVRSGRTGSPPPEAGRVVRYCGPAWLIPVPRKGIDWERLDQALAAFATAGRRERESILWGLLYGSQKSRRDLPVVDHYKIVGLLARLAVEARPRQVAEDEEPPPGMDFAEFGLLALMDMVPAEQLKDHADALGALAARAGDRRVAELLVKAGSVKALKELAAGPDRLPAEGRERLVLAMRAASGDEKGFAALLDAFAGAKDAPVKAELGRLLALVGREEGLKALAGQMRDARVFRDVRGQLRSVRSELADSMRLAHPEYSEFYTCVLPSRKEMAGVEMLCFRHYGVEYQGQPPADDGEGSESGVTRPVNKDG